MAEPTVLMAVYVNAQRYGAQEKKLTSDDCFKAKNRCILVFDLVVMS